MDRTPERLGLANPCKRFHNNFGFGVMKQARPR